MHYLFSAKFSSIQKLSILQQSIFISNLRSVYVKEFFMYRPTPPACPILPASALIEFSLRETFFNLELSNHVYVIAMMSGIFFIRQ